ncbi:MAG: FAD-dependent oxidoreductase [Lachnospiraceae bacterium]|nr:FAD-dependent oxidoreductase [Lachnospiraceae bacterium]
MMYDVIVVGAGPAGLGAAIEAAKAGASVLILDENDRPGGQLFKQIHKFFGSGDHYAGTRGFRIGENLLKEAADAGVEIKLSTRVWGLYPGGIVAAATEEESRLYHGRYLILATGASENSLVFKGNTLPGVITAGAAQTMVNIRHVRPGETAVVVGSGNVGLIVSYQLMQAGMDVAAIVEAAPEVTGYAVHAAKVRRAGVPILTSHTVVEGRGERELEAVVIAEVDDRFRVIPGTEQTIKADTLCVAVGLTPRTELSAIAGCRMAYSPALGGRIPAHNEDLETTKPGILIAGDLSGIEEASTALDEGRLAGTKAAEGLGLLTPAAAETRKALIRNRIAALRQGRFGDKRRIAKQVLWDEYKNRGDNT